MNKMKKSENIVISLMILAIFGKVLGLIRDALIASKFGINRMLDSYFLANTIILLVSTLMTQSINTTVIPMITKAENELGIEGKNKLINNILHIFIILSSIITIILVMVLPYISSIIAAGFQTEYVKMTTDLARIGVVNIIFSSITGIFRAYLQSEEKYLETAFSDLLLAIFNILALLLLVDDFGIGVLMISAILAGFTQVIIQIIGLKKTAYKYKFYLSFKDPYIYKIVALTIPVFISTGISDISKLVDKAMASTLPSGAISALNFAGKVNTIFLGVFITSIITVIFPKLSRASSEGDYFTIRKNLIIGTNSILIITIPICAFMIILASPIIKILFEYGSFDTAATNITAEALKFYSLSLVGMSIRLLLIKVFYALHDTKTPVRSGIIIICLNICLNIILMKPLGFRGLALATSISSVFMAIILFVNLNKKIRGLNIRNILNTIFKVCIAAAIMSLFTYFSHKYFFESLMKGFISNICIISINILISSTIYLFLIILFKVEEAIVFFEKLKLNFIDVFRRITCQ